MKCLPLLATAATAGCGGASEGAPACCAPEEPVLLAKGWTRRFVGDARMTEEATALYSRLGYEVMAVPLDDASVSEPCTGCEVTLRTFRVLYTRRLES